MNITSPETVAAHRAATDLKPVNVLFVNDHLGFADGVIHGPARYFYNILEHFDRSVINPQLCILRDWHPFANELESKGIQPIFLSRRKWNPYVLMDLIWLVRKLEIDVLHLAGMKGCIIGRIVSKITGTPAVIHFRDMNPSGAITRLVQRMLSGWTDIALAVSGPVREFAIKEFAVPVNKIEVLHNPVSDRFLHIDYDDRDKIRSEFNISSEKRVAAIIGRLSPEKGHELFIRSLPALISACPETVLCIVGDGPTMDACKLLVRKLKLEHAVRFTGYRNDIPSLLAAVDAVVMPSEREGFPNAALEAIAAGKPVVAFSVGGLPEIVIDGKTGYLSPPGNIDGIVKSLLKILTDDERAKRMREECCRHAAQFTVARHTKRLGEIYRKILPVKA